MNNTISTKAYDAFMTPFEKKYLHNIRNDLIPKAKGNILEIGSGNGKLIFIEHVLPHDKLLGHMANKTKS